MTEKKKSTFFCDKYGDLRIGWCTALMMIVIAALVGAIFAFVAWLSWRDCPTLCEANDAEPVWTITEFCSCAKNGELKDPTAPPVEVRFR